MTGAEMIAAERQRQLDREGWTVEHDDEHRAGELVFAAVSYALAPGNRFFDADGLPYYWPWEKRYWKPTPGDRIRELVKAGALIAAEIDRLARR